ncbi:DUF4350 domain-containing protein [Microbacterium sp. STN6]|uniref:DUF4350 domain-containing protein n=1 Tax=Microbacterium sp. STN6 TaxID=2995588 RepID=UPI002260894C|nr:DUF4350 domain-containing protein [Microbacterium sp. STN6]MCX7521082.1 DUF4350 domain-containing protein [Microbacterium sp. STN6]
MSEQGTMRAAAAQTPTLRQALRGARFWLVLAAIAVVVVIATLIIRGAGDAASDIELGATNPAPDGAGAVVQVLRDHGVHVVEAGSLREARRATARDSHATLLYYDPKTLLTADTLRSMRALAPSIVAIDPSFAALQALAPGVSAAGVARHSTNLPAGTGCTDASAARAGTITASGSAYRVSGDAQGCFSTGGGAWAMAQQRTDGRLVTVLGSTDLVSNQSISHAGNAALALGLLGADETLVWYLPTLADVAASGPPSLAELTPGWVTPVMVLLIATALAAAFWRGRRFGPLVVEDLPVTVRAEETMEGRARLYQRASARLRALDALRVGTITRFARRLGLPESASVSEVSDAAAALLGRDPREVRGILLDSEPGTDTELVALTDRLTALERAVTRASVPGGASASPHEATQATRTTNTTESDRPGE